MTLRYAVNLSILFTELPPHDRPAAATAAGFDAVELWWPFPDPVPTAADVDTLLGSLDAAGVRLVAMNFAAGDVAAGERGWLSQPANSARFRDNVGAMVRIASRTGCRLFNALYGNRVPGVDPEEQDSLAVDNLAYAARAVGEFGGTVLVEPQTRADNEGYPLRTAADVVAVLDRVRRETGAENLRLLADVYHLARNGEDVPHVLATYLDRIGHVQIADPPGRHQPGTGDLDVPALLDQLDRSGYTGYIAAEYVPIGPSAETFGWISR